MGNKLSNNMDLSSTPRCANFGVCNGGHADYLNSLMTKRLQATINHMLYYYHINNIAKYDFDWKCFGQYRCDLVNARRFTAKNGHGGQVEAL